MEIAMQQLFIAAEASGDNQLKSPISRFMCALLSLCLLAVLQHNRRVSRTGGMLGV